MIRLRKIGRNYQKFVLAFAAVFLLQSALYAEERIVNLEASVDYSEIGVQDTLTLTVTVDTENVKSISKPALPRLDAFSVVNESSSTRTSVSIVNGKTTHNRELKIVYTLKPLKKGTFVIDPIIVQYKGDTYSTDPVTVKVVEGHVAKKPEGYMLDEGSPLDIEKLKNEILLYIFKL